MTRTYEDGGEPWLLWPFEDAPTALREIFTALVQQTRTGRLILDYPRSAAAEARDHFGGRWVEEHQLGDRIIVLLT